MKNPRALVMIGFSVVVGLVAVVMAGRWLSQQGSVATTQVVVASSDINLGTALDPGMLQMVTWPSGSIPKGSFNDRKGLDTRVLQTSVMRGEPILESKLAPLGTKGGLSAVIAAGKRALTVKVNEVVGVAGFARPGNYVDVMVNTEDDNKRPLSKIVLERILVLAVAQEVSRDETKPKVVNAVTLEVTPEQAEKLDLARSVGTLSLALRNQVDENLAATPGIRKNELLAKTGPQTETKPATAQPARTAKRPRAKASQPKEKVEIIRGIEKSEVKG